MAWEGTCSREGERLEEDGGESKGKGREGWGRTACLPSQSHNSTNAHGIGTMEGMEI